MSIKEKIEKELQELVDETGGCEEDLKNEKLQIKQTLSFILLALKDELMGMVNDEIDERISLWKSHGTEAPLAGIYSHLTLTGELEVIRSQIIAAINKLCEEK